MLFSDARWSLGGPRGSPGVARELHSGFGGENECLCQQYEEGEIWCKDVAMCKDEGFACKIGPDAGNSPPNLILLIRAFIIYLLR